MAIHFEWKDETQTVVLLRYDSTWTWQEFREAINKVDEAGAVLDHPYYLINDVRVTPSLPNGQAIAHFRAVGATNYVNLRYVYIVGPNMLAASLLNMMKKLVPNIDRTWRVVSNMETAEAMIAADKAGARVPVR